MIWKYLRWTIRFTSAWSLHMRVLKAIPYNAHFQLNSRIEFLVQLFNPQSFRGSNSRLTHLLLPVPELNFACPRRHHADTWVTSVQTHAFSLSFASRRQLTNAFALDAPPPQRSPIRSAEVEHADRALCREYRVDCSYSMSRALPDYSSLALDPCSVTSLAVIRFFVILVIDFEFGFKFFGGREALLA